MLIERHLGAHVLLGSYLLNCVTSAATQVVAQRHFGYAAYRRRGRHANFNGNSALFLVSLFAAAAPSYALRVGASPATTFYFYYIALAYGLIYFTEFTTNNRSRTGGNVVRTARNDNETHYSGAALGLLLGLMLRKRVRMF